MNLYYENAYRQTNVNIFTLDPSLCCKICIYLLIEQFYKPEYMDQFDHDLHTYESYYSNKSNLYW